MAVLKRCAPEICEYCGERLRARVVKRCFRCGGPNERRLTFGEIWREMTLHQRFNFLPKSLGDKIYYCGVDIEAEE